jgi:hypothetical protein
MSAPTPFGVFQADASINLKNFIPKENIALIFELEFKA